MEIFGPVTHDQLKKIIDKPKLEVANVDSKPNVGFFEPVTQDPIYNWIWADVQEENKDFDNYENFNQDDLRDPDMTTIGTGKVSIKGGLISESFHFGSNLKKKKLSNHYPEHLLFRWIVLFLRFEPNALSFYRSQNVIAIF